MAFFGWLSLAAAYYFYIPIFHTIWLYARLLIGFGWVSADVWTFTTGETLDPSALTTHLVLP
jgi:hypothetical protein